MKNLPLILSFTAAIGLVILIVTTALGVPVPFARIASNVVEFSVVAGMLGFFLADYARPRPRYYADVRVAEPKREASRVAPAFQNMRRIPDPVGLSIDDAVTLDLIAKIELRNDPASASLT